MRGLKRRHLWPSPRSQQEENPTEGYNPTTLSDRHRPAGRGAGSRTRVSATARRSGSQSTDPCGCHSPAPPSLPPPCLPRPGRGGTELTRSLISSAMAAVKCYQGDKLLMGEVLRLLPLSAMADRVAASLLLVLSPASTGQGAAVPRAPGQAPAAPAQPCRSPPGPRAEKPLSGSPARHRQVLHRTRRCRRSSDPTPRTAKEGCGGSKYICSAAAPTNRDTRLLFAPFATRSIFIPSEQLVSLSFV